jgi:molybdopterin molybdotransferase
LYMLAAQISAYGGEPLLAGAMSDQPEEARRRLYDIMDGEADLVLTTGGVSVGDFDVVADILADWDGLTLFNKITMRPGSPTSAGVRQGKLLIGLSGNPAACFIGCELLVRSVLRQMQGERATLADEHDEQAILAADYGKVNAYTRYVRGIRYTEGTTVYVRQQGADRSSAVVSLKEANCLIVIPPTKTGIAAGTIVNIIML